MVAACEGEEVTRKIITVSNILFLTFGVFMLIIGIIGMNRSNQIKGKAEILTLMNVNDTSLIVTICAVATIVAALLGIIGAVKRIPNLLKSFVMIMFLVVIIELAMGIYLRSLSISVLKDPWYEESAKGHDQRVDFQSYFTCCGWFTRADSVPPPQSTPCPASYSRTCSQAADTYITDEIGPIAAGCLAISVFEICVLALSCFIVFRASEKESDEDNPYGF